MEVVGMVADTASSSGKGVRYGAFGGGGVTVLVVEVLLGVGRFDVDRCAEMAIFDADIDVEKGDMGRGGVPGEVDGIPNPDLPVAIHTQSHQIPFQKCWSVSVIHKLPDSTPDHIHRQFETAYQLVLQS